MNDETTPEVVADPAASPETATETTQPPSQAPSQQEKPKIFTKRERLAHAKEKIERQLDELDHEEDDNRPVTVGDLKKMKREEVKATAIELAASIEDEDERNAVVDILENRIAPSNKPEEDLALARGAVNSVRNQRLLEEQARKATPATVSSAPGNPGRPPEGQFVPTPEEAYFMQHFGLSKEQVLVARRKEAESR